MSQSPVEVATVGVGPHPLPWPDDPRLDPDLLEQGDRRNVADHYRYWTMDAIIADLDSRRHPLHIAIENLQHDFNIGSIVRTANAFLAKEVHIVGKARWNRRGAMVTDRYQHIRHHALPEDLHGWATQAGQTIVGLDNVEGAVPIQEFTFPQKCVLLFGQEGPGISSESRSICADLVYIPQFGSTRSINVGAAAAIAMYEWMRQHVLTKGPE